MNKELNNQVFNNVFPLGTKTEFKDGTTYVCMPNGNLIRSSKRAFEIRKEAKRILKK